MSNKVYYLINSNKFNDIYYMNFMNLNFDNFPITYNSVMLNININNYILAKMHKKH